MGDSNATTGFEWIADRTSCASIITSVNKLYVPTHETAGWVGGGGKQYFEF